MFIPTTREEVITLGWDKLDIILVSGDTYIDSSHMGVSVIGHVLINHGFKVGIITQPDIATDIDITRLGEPSLFWGITSGCVDSMVSNYTATKKRRNNDDLTPGGKNDRRPDRAVIVYTNLIKQYCSKTVPIVIGGIEASLRRIAHYDYWDNKVRRPILFDSKADILVYGMGEKSVIELANTIKQQKTIHSIKGICYISKQAIDSYITLPSFELVSKDRNAFNEMFKLFHSHANNNTSGMQQKHNDRYLIQNPPQAPLQTHELDRIYDLPYERDIHPYYKKNGEVRALDTIRFSITTHRGCFGGCNFCAISIHQGTTISSRSKQSIINETIAISNHPQFKGIINDLGGPTANMYGMVCQTKKPDKQCKTASCLQNNICKNLQVSHKKIIDLLQDLRTLPKIKKIFIQSGIRYDLILKDHTHGKTYLKEIIKHHISGQLKVAPEHSEEFILSLMNKPSITNLILFKKMFDNYSRQFSKKQFLTYYFIAAHPGTTLDDMKKLNQFIKQQLHIRPEQVQIFTPTPSTCSTAMYHTETDPFSGKKIFVEKNQTMKEKQKKTIQSK